MLAGLGAADQLAPLDHADFSLDADLGQVGLQHLRAEAGVGVEQAARRAGPDRGAEAFTQASLGQQRLGFLQVQRVAGQVLGVAPGIGRVGSVGGHRGIFEHGLEIGLLVESQVDGLAHFRFAQRRVLAVDGDEGGHERRGAGHLEGAVLARFGNVQWLG